MNGEGAAVNQKRMIPEIVRQILARRGVPDGAMERFLWPEYERDLHDPMLMTDMAAAAERLAAAGAAGEKVAVYGDYDIDGITATALMLEALTAAGAKAQGYIPDRFEEGYGINQAALEKLQAQGFTLVVSVDCGITSVGEAKWAREHGLDLVITDHHDVPAVIPEACAVVNPKRPGDGYPFKDLAGVGVAFKLACALQTRVGAPAAGQEKWLLDLVALGTVCDVVPLVGENRVLVSYGLRVLRQTRRPGIAALAAVASVDQAGLQAHHLGFVLGPRMNAAGRVEHAQASLELVRTDDRERAQVLARELDELNQRRRATQAEVFEAANQQAQQRADSAVLVVADDAWSHGVVGIVASKLVEKWHRPVLVAQIMAGETKGSARSVPGFNMVEALRANAELLTKFGGHFYAAGFTLATERLDEFRAGMNAYFAEQAVALTDTAPAAEIEFGDLADVDMALLEALELLEPCGRGNELPNFELRGLVVQEARPVGQTGTHLRLVLNDELGRRLTGIGFGLAERYTDLRAGQHLTARGVLNKNVYQGRSSVQLQFTELHYE